MNNSTYYLFFTHLANPLKVKIMFALKNAEMGVTELSNILGVEQSNLSHSLSSLKNCNIVEAKRTGKRVIYSLNKSTILPILNLAEKHACTQCKKCFFKRK